MARRIFLVSDFETITRNTMNKLGLDHTGVLFASTSELIDVKDDERVYHDSTNIHDWWEHLISYQTNLVVYFHNLAHFDGHFIIPFFESMGFEVCNEYKLKKHNSYRIFAQGNEIYNIVYRYDKFHNFMGKRKHVKFTIDFRCSYKILSNSVEALGKGYGIAKKLEDEDETFYDVEPKKTVAEYGARFIEYVHNDVLIVIKSLLDFRKTLMEVPLLAHHNKYRAKPYDPFVKELTITGIMWKLAKMYQNYYNRMDKKKGRWFVNVDVETYDVVKPFLRGGFSQFNPKYNQGNIKDIKNALFTDVVSAYPYQMTKALPWGKIYAEPPKRHAYATMHIIEVKKAKIKPECKDVVCLVNWKKKNGDWDNEEVDIKKLLATKRYCEELENFTCYYWDEEWDILQKYYDFEVKSITSWYMLKSPFMSGLEKQLYQLKLQAEQEGNKAKRQAVKILLNCGYGMFAKRRQYPDQLYFKKGYEPEVKDDTFEYTKQGKKQPIPIKYENQGVSQKLTSPNIDTLVVMRGMEIDKNITYLPNVAAGSYITALQRVNLLNKIYEVGTKYFGYSDTDSILFCNLPDKLYNKLNQPCKELGAWDVEMTREEFDAINIYKTKGYTLLKKKGDSYDPVKERFGGVRAKSAKYIHTRFGESEFIIENATLKRTRVKGGIVLEPVDKKIKRGDL